MGGSRGKGKFRANLLMVEGRGYGFCVLFLLFLFILARAPCAVLYILIYLIFSGYTLLSGLQYFGCDLGAPRIYFFLG